MGAAEVATNALADTVNSRTSDVAENLGILEKTWRVVANSAKWAWDQMLNLGREDSIADQIIALNDKIRDAGKINVTGRAQGGVDPAAVARAVAGFKEERRILSIAYKAESDKAARDQQIEQGRVASLSLAEEARQGQTNAQKRIAAHKRISVETEIAIQGIESTNVEVRIAEIKKLKALEASAIAAADEKYKDPKTPKAKKSQEAKDAEKLIAERARQYEGLDKALDQHKATLEAAGEAEDKLSSFERYAIKTLADMAEGHTVLTSAQQAEFKVRIDGLRVLDQENIAREKQVKIMEVSADLNRQIAQDIAAQTREHNREMIGIGRGQEQGQLELALEDIRYAANQKRAVQEKRYQDLKAVGSAQYLQDMADIDNAEEYQTQAEIEQLRRKKDALADWRNGARSAIEDIQSQFGNTAGTVRDSFLTAFGAMNNALNNFANTGKLKIKDFAITVIAELLRIALTIATSRILTNILGGGVSSGSGFSVVANGGVVSGGNRVAANGVVASGGQLTTYANGGLPFGGFGGVRTSPTLRSMANGGSLLMSEERPEAVVPLQRGPNGKMGVASTGGGGGVSVTSHVYISNDGSSKSDTKSDGDNALEGKRLGDLINQKIEQVLVEQRRQGGLLWGMQFGR